MLILIDSSRMAVAARKAKTKPDRLAGVKIALRVVLVLVALAASYGLYAFATREAVVDTKAVKKAFEVVLLSHP
jgi:hypothetical protein